MKCQNMTVMKISAINLTNNLLIKKKIIKIMTKLKINLVNLALI